MYAFSDLTTVVELSICWSKRIDPDARGADERTNQESSSRRSRWLRSAAHRKVAERPCPRLPPPRPHTPAVACFSSTASPSETSAVWSVRVAVKVCLDAFKDAGVHRNDHYVPAIGQTEASSGSAAATAAAQHRTAHLSWCEWIDSCAHSLDESGVCCTIYYSFKVFTLDRPWI